MVIAKKKERTFLITGGTGFIGSHIAELLIKEGHNVIILDNLRSGLLKNIADLNVQFVKGSILDKSLVNNLMAGIDGIFHLGALISVPESLDKVKECIDINVNGSINLLEAAKQNVRCKLVLSSSAAIYGNNPVLPKIEEMLPEPLSPYAVTKLDGEYYFKIYRENWQVPTVSLRYFNVFGPRQNPKSAYAAAVPIFINKALRDEPIVIYGDGNQTRDFIYVKDVARANLLAFKSGTGTYNVALGQSLSILELAKKIIEITNSKSSIKYEKERAGDVKHSKASVVKLQKLGFKPSYSLEKGLNETIQYYESVMLKN